MSILAMAPPVPLGGKLFVALLMLVLVGVLIRTIRRVSFTGRSMRVAAVTVVFVLESVLLSSYGGGFHDRGVLAAVVGALSGAALLRPLRGSARLRSSNTVGLSALAFISGSFLGLILASVTVFCPVCRRWIEGTHLAYSF